MQIVIQPKKSWHIDWRELWAYRELFWAIALRDIKVRYKQTALGASWAIFQPFLMMVVFSVFFGRIMGVSSGDVPYPIFVYTGLLFWQYFNTSLTKTSESMIAHQSIIQKVYFPRLIIPIAGTIVHLIDFFFATIIFIGLMIYYQTVPTLIGVVLIAPALLITFFSFSGAGLIFTSINVKYRDVRLILPFFMQLLLFVTPVIYPASILGKYQWLWYLNPMSGVIETMRTGLLGLGDIRWHLFGASAILSIVLFVVGIIYFNKTEKDFADII